MPLAEILMPLADNEGRPFVRTALTEKCGGVTAFTRAPGEGVFETGGKPVHDDIVVVEVMTLWTATFGTPIARG